MLTAVLGGGRKQRKETGIAAGSCYRGDSGGAEVPALSGWGWRDRGGKCLGLKITVHLFVFFPPP